MRPSVDIIGNFGGLINLTKATDLYLGIYASYGFLDILPKEKVDYIEYTSTTANANGLLNSNALETYNNDKRYDVTVSEKWNLFQAGIKVGLRFNTCHQKQQSKREDIRDFLDKYEEKAPKPRPADEPKDDGKGRGKSEPVYIIPVYVGDPNNSGNKGGKGSNGPDDIDPVIDDLIKSLMAAQIYFDLDKDIPNNPRLAHREVDRAVTILKNNPNIKIIIDGYTCRLGTETHNQDLGQRRANTIRNMFIAKGADPKQIETEAFTVANYPKGMVFPTLEDARTVIFRIIKQ
jgi:outer membrane protein OmpA-like peptidoglycan-associated protein